MKLIGKSKTEEERKLKFVFGIFMLIVGISLFIFRDFWIKISDWGYFNLYGEIGSIGEIVTILLIVLLPCIMLLIYNLFLEIHNKRTKNNEKGF